MAAWKQGVTIFSMRASTTVLSAARFDMQCFAAWPVRYGEASPDWRHRQGMYGCVTLCHLYLSKQVPKQGR